MTTVELLEKSIKEWKTQSGNMLRNPSTLIIHPYTWESIERAIKKLGWIDKIDKISTPTHYDTMAVYRSNDIQARKFIIL